MTQQRSRKSLGWRIAAWVFAAVFVASATALISFFLPQAGQPGLVSSVPLSAPVSDQPVRVENPIDFAALQAENPEIVAWISVPGTHIDYAILQSGTVHPEEDYYLYRDEKGNHRRSGSIYIQQQNSANFTDPNTVIYGHNMANGSMFADLHQYRAKEDFFNKNDTIYVYTPGHIYTYRLYSAFVFDNRHILNAYNFHDKEGFSAFLQETLSPSSMQRRVRQGVSVTDRDRIITLSTCYARDDQRYLVIGVLTNEQLTF